MITDCSNCPMRDDPCARTCRDVVLKKERKIEYWKNAALCEKPRGSCRACKTKNCYFKDKTEG